MNSPAPTPVPWWRVGPYDREIWRLALPAFATLVAEPLYVLADTAVVGHLGTEQLAGLAAATNILLTLFAILIFLAYGTTASVSRLLGAGRQDEAARQAVQGMWLALGIGISVALLGQVVAPTFLRWFGTEGAVLHHGLVYLRISLIGFPFLLVGLAGTGYLRGLQDTRTPLVVAVGTALFNLVLELVLINGLGFGIGASALSTVLAQLIGAAIYLWAVGRSVRGFNVDWRPDLTAIRSLLVVGRDLMIRTASLRGSFLIGAAVAARIGTDELAAHQIAFEVWGFLALALDAVAIAAQAIIGRYLGAGDTHEARRAGRRMLEWGLAAGLLAAIAVLVSLPVLPAVFTEDTAVADLLRFLLLWVAISQPLNGVVFALDGILIGASDMGYLALAMLGAAVIFLPLAFGVAVADLGIGWLWAAITMFMAARGLGLLVRFLGPRWAIPGAER
ncbi:MAG: MATE family efflux transporter [Actinomycetia bacterium]|nr:MATE family efflux transporter [Actinomycetes bacterium]